VRNKNPYLAHDPGLRQKETKKKKRQWVETANDE
jgi:hypothetical protein